MGIVENPQYLATQLITYLGNKRNLLPFIAQVIEGVRKRLHYKKLKTFDVFAGSGSVSRLLKQYSSELYCNDLEEYATVINQCYLTNKEDFPQKEFEEYFFRIRWFLEHEPLREGFITRLYAPRDDTNIQKGERVFYTRRNAQYLDTARQLIALVPPYLQKFFLGPLLSEASIHANTAGIFKGFYKNRHTGIGQFGGSNQDALYRIMGHISLQYPVLSNFSCYCQVLNGDANSICESVPEVDVAYLDPPYNEHPYGSNYFMLNLIVQYQEPQLISQVSGIPKDWKRSVYNKRSSALKALEGIIEKIQAKYILVSFNSEGFISFQEMQSLLKKYGQLEILEIPYNVFRGSRNLASRPLHVKEYIYLLEKY
ncbi:MAG: DNA adenine methylase [Treponemataceae bacterium]|nr:DNA adenine methylase [Treponemataceae bacterium]